MEIRRSCYSVLDDGLYSTADVYPEYRLYSDIDDDYVIDACIEKAFSDGYDYAYQRMFAKSKQELKEIEKNRKRQGNGKVINPALEKKLKKARKDGTLQAYRESRATDAAYKAKLKEIDDAFALDHPAVKDALAAEQARSASALAEEQARSARMNKALNYYRGEGRELAMKNARKQVGLREAFGNASRGKKAALIGGGLAALGAAGTAGYFAGRRNDD